MKDNDAYWMEKALALAYEGVSSGEVPVGSVIVLDNQIIGEGYNCPISAQDPTAHAEIIALRMAAKKIGNYRLLNTTLYVTLEPCVMCMGAMSHARIQRLVFGAYDPKTGIMNHKIETKGGILEEPCAKLLQQFFKEKRQ
jgi:tRNA(adenine34) deaminase